ncbi:hypothetical protein [Nocardia rhizosphaerae]|uniref:DUF4365 domain-containing protein n=1 Tax=Nocardia rhizosphaerae TaxID=1691571 RepID=A0ABV8L2B0_9NOCA
MPSYLHEALLDLFRNELSPAFALLADEFGVPVPDLAHLRAEPCDFTDIGPKEFRGDLASSTHDARDRPVLGVCLEVQLDPKDVRRWKWPVYLTTLRSRLCCPVVLLVVTPSPKVAKWAEQSIELDTSGRSSARRYSVPTAFPWSPTPTRQGDAPNARYSRQWRMALDRR